MDLNKLVRRAFRRIHARSVRAFVAILVMAISLPAGAMDSYLPPEDIDKAYSLGRSNNREDLAAFFRLYQRNPKYPSDKPLAYVKFVEFQTPYEQIVLRSQRTAGYTGLRADDDYEANPGLVLVRVVVALKLNYAGPEPAADSFKVSVSQANPIEPGKVTATVLCNPFNATETSTAGDCVGYSREVDLTFDVSQFGPGAAKIKVALPESASQEISFDLDKMK